MTKNVDEVAKWFSAINQLDGANFGAEVYPGYPGVVVANGELRKMTWGFPLILKSKKTGKPLKAKPVNNTRSDKLKAFMWRYSFEERRCLIPLTAWAEPQGPKGAKTRTWMSIPNEEIFAVAGIWRESEEFGLCYSMIMVDAAGDAAQVHNRMPVVLSPSDSQEWVKATPQRAYELCRPFPNALSIDRTDEKWNK